MGVGDELIAAGEAKRRARTQRALERRFAIWDARVDKQRWHEVWFRNPLIAEPGQPFEEKIFNHPGCRPYIAEKSMRRWVWKAYQPEPADLVLTDWELSFAEKARGCIVVNPTLKPLASPNKAWGWPRWQKLISLRPDLPWLQIGLAGSSVLTGVRFLETPSFRTACGALKGARAAVLQEGGLHHAAAALGVPAVVLFGGFISPECTGYETQRSLFDRTELYPLGCGMRSPCFHCEKSMDRFSPKIVHRNLEELLT